MLQQEDARSLEEPLLTDADRSVDPSTLRQFDFHAGFFLFNEYCSNRVTTSMYTPWTFFPRFLGQTFSKTHNLYFLCICVLEMIPSISTSGGFPTTALPLLMVTAVDACFRLVEDYARHQDDKKANNRRADRLGPDLSFESVPWADLRVGDLVQVCNGDLVPADIVLLQVVDNVGHRAFCYVETASLDGETSLKMRQALPDTQSLPLTKLHGRVQCDAPTAAPPDGFSGTLLLSDVSFVIPISATNVLLRDCVLRNTHAVLGVVFHAGKDTKVQQSAATCPSKQSRIDALVNHELVYIFALTLVVCVASAAASTAFDVAVLPYAWYLHAPVSTLRHTNLATKPATSAGAFIVSFLRFFLMMSNAVPISLYVTLNIVKSLQAQTIQADAELTSDGLPCQVKTMALNDDLGQVSHIVTDKTGTLTRNVMVFRSCSVHGTLYGDLSASQPQSPWLDFSDPAFDRATDTSSFLLHLALSHSVLADTPTTSLADLAAAASSPDELALLAMAYHHGYKFVRRAPGKAVLQVPGSTAPVEFDILHVLEFTSSRKRMSVVVRNPLRGNQIELLMKGADSVVLARLATDGHDVVDVTRRHLKQLAQRGLRTLVVAKRDVSEAEYANWVVKYNAAARDLAQLQLRAKNEPNAIDALVDELERGVHVLGATGVEDALQAMVPESIEKLRVAGIKIWMLTGDHVDTAVNVARAANLLKNTAVQLTLVAATRIRAADELARLQKVVESKLHHHKYALVVDGETIHHLLTHAALTAAFARVVEGCEVVLACRVSPLQKAQIVVLLKDLTRGSERRVLAIGDGANDVAMLQTAHVGVGIRGHEGMQAANCSDFAIAQFSMLVRLLFVHGRRNVMRVGFLIPYIFYKNVLLVLSEVWYCLVNGASGQKVYNQVAVDFFNTFYTALPVIAYAVYDKDLPSWLCERLPSLYAGGQRTFSRRVIWQWMAYGMAESFVICMVAVLTMSNTDVHGRPFGMWECGALIFTQIVLVVNYKLALHQNTWKVVQVAALGLSIGCWFVSGFVLSASPGVSYQWFDIFPIVMGSTFYWMASLIIPVIALSFDFVSRAVQHAFNPTNERVLQEAVYATHDPDLHLRLLQLPEKQPAPATGYAVAIDEYTASVEAEFCRRLASPVVASRRSTIH